MISRGMSMLRLTRTQAWRERLLDVSLEDLLLGGASEHRHTAPSSRPYARQGRRFGLACGELIAKKRPLPSLRLSLAPSRFGIFLL